MAPARHDAALYTNLRLKRIQLFCGDVDRKSTEGALIKALDRRWPRGYNKTDICNCAPVGV